MSTPESFIPRENPYLNKVFTLLAGLIILGILAYIELPKYCCTQAPPPELEETPTIAIKVVESVFAEHRKTDPTYPLPGYIAEQIPLHQNINDVKKNLTLRASDAVQNDDRLALGSALALLGAASLYENDLHGSRVYLDEALEVYEEQNDAMGIGSVELLRSRVETVARENARDAASAYEVMQIAAWMIVKQRFYETEKPIESAIQENLRLDRYGSAAAGYEMLERGYRSVGDFEKADKAAKEAMLLHAGSGRTIKARNILTKLQNTLLTQQEFEQLKKRIEEEESNYENSILQVRVAQEYEHVFRRLVAAGDPVQAWTFRQKANQSLSDVSKHAMHRRQTGIVALLYNSNDNIEAARNSLERARAIFDEESRTDLLEHTESADSLIW